MNDFDVYFMAQTQKLMLQPDAFCESTTQQKRLRPGLRPRPRWGSLQRSPGPLAGFKRAASRLGRGRFAAVKVEEWKEGEKEGKCKGRGREGRESDQRWSDGKGEGDLELGCRLAKGAITSKIKLAIKHKTSPARLAQLLQPSLAFCFSLQPMMAYHHWTTGQSCWTRFMFYCKFYFTCDRSLRPALAATS